MSFFDTQNPGIGGIDELTDAETLFVQNLAALSYAKGDILYFNGTSLTRLAPTTDGYVLTTHGANANPTWESVAGVSGASLALDNLSSVAINAALVLGTSDAFALGSATKMWSDLFLASGAVINFNNGNITLTHSAGVLTLGGGNLALGTNSITMTGSLAATGARVTKGWFTDAEFTNVPTIGGTGLGDIYASISQAFYIGTTSVAINRASASLALTGITSIDGSAASVTGLSVTAGKTLTVQNSLTFSGTDASSVAFGTGGTVLYSGGALGTPSSGTLTNCTGLPIAGLTASTATALGVGSIELGHASDTSITRVSAGVISVEGVTVDTISATNTLTNKRITKRTGTTTSSATPTINTDTVDFYSLTAQAADITSFTTNLTGTPTEGQTLWIAITGTAARAITWGTSFEASTVALPTTTVTTARLDVGFVWNTVTSKWRCIATA